MPVLSFMRSAAFLLAGVVSISVTEADTLVLSNGDRLTGTIIRQEEGQVVFQSSVLGVVRIPAEEATIVTSSDEEATTARLSQSRSNPVPVTKAPETRAPESRESDWKRQVELGLSAQDGLREQRNLSVRLEAARTVEDGSVRVVLSHQYGKLDGALVTDATSANATLTRNLSEDVFLRGATRFDRDSVVGLDHDAEQSLGLGYNLVNNSNVSIAVGGGAALRNRDTRDSSATWDGLVDAFGRLRCAFTDRLSLSQNLSVSAAPDNATDYRLKSQTALVNQLTDVLRMTLRYEIEYHGTALAAVPMRQRLVTAIGCEF